jgi:hypothetical protein
MTTTPRKVLCVPSETQETIGEWNRATFGEADDFGPQHALRLLEEVAELCLDCGASEWEIHNTLGLAVFRASGKFLDAEGRSRGHRERFPRPASAPGEMADCAIVLYGLAERRGVDLHAEIDKKMKTNRSRTWAARGDGTGYHICTGDQDAQKG